MSQFRKPHIVLREAKGAYLRGVYVPGLRTFMTISASVQPVKQGQDLQALPQGRRWTDYKKIYTSSELVSGQSELGSGVQSDIIVSNNYGYELVDVDENQSGVIPHYKYLAVRLFKFTTGADWVSGALVRSRP